MLELTNLNILSSPSYVHWYHAAPNVVMEEDFPVAEPSHVGLAGAEEDEAISSWVAHLEAGSGAMSEMVGSGAAGALGLVKEEKDE